MYANFHCLESFQKHSPYLLRAGSLSIIIYSLNHFCVLWVSILGQLHAFICLIDMAMERYIFCYHFDTSTATNILF